MMAKYFATSFAMLKGRERAARNQELFSDFDDLDQLRRVRIEIDHVARFFCGLRAGVHRDADIGLRERGRVVRAVAGHRHEMTTFLFSANQRQLLLRRSFGEEVIDAGFFRDRRGGPRIVTRDHDGANAHGAETLETIRESAFDDVLKVNRAEHFLVLRRRRAVCRPDRRSYRHRTEQLSAGCRRRTPLPDRQRLCDIWFR